MTIRPIRLAGPRRRIPTPRIGARRGGGLNPVVASNATTWFSAHDGSGLQQIPSRVGAAVATLGSTTGADGNDPVWSATPDVWTFDATDDYISTTATTPNVTATTGKHTVIVLFSFAINSNGHFWSSGTSSSQRFMVFPGSSTTIQAQARGATTAVSTVAQTFPSTVSRTKTVVGLVADTGGLKSYLYQGSTGSMSASANITGIGTMALSAPRIGNAAYATTAPIGGKIHEVVEWYNQALDQATLDTVAAYLISKA